MHWLLITSHFKFTHICVCHLLLHPAEVSQGVKQLVANMTAIGVMWEYLSAAYPLGGIQLTGQIVVPGFDEGGVKPYDVSGISMSPQGAKLYLNQMRPGGN